MFNKKNPPNPRHVAIGYCRATSGTDRVSELYLENILRSPVCLDRKYWRKMRLGRLRREEARKKGYSPLIIITGWIIKFYINKNALFATPRFSKYWWFQNKKYWLRKFAPRKTKFLRTYVNNYQQRIIPNLHFLNEHFGRIAWIFHNI